MLVRNSMELTCFIKHFVALIEDEHLKVFELELLSANESKNSAWGSDNDVWSLCSIFENLDVIVDWHSSVESGASYLLQVLCESIELLLDLIRQLSSIAKNECSIWLWIILIDLVEDRECKYSSLTHSRHSLAEDVLA